MSSYLHIILISTLLLNSSIGFAQSALTTREGSVLFFSSAPLEDIKATNDRVRAALNTETGEVFIRMRVSDFQFAKALMQKHFNEEYMESHLYPEAQLSGKIEDFNLTELRQTKTNVIVKGEMTIHGVSRTIRENATVRMDGERVICEAVFEIRVEDYGVRIPRLLMRNIAEVVEVTVLLELR